MEDPHSILDVKEDYDYSAKMKDNRKGWAALECKVVNTYAPVEYAELLKAYLNAVTGKHLVEQIEAKNEDVIFTLADRRSRYVTSIADLHGPSQSPNEGVKERAQKLTELIMKRNQFMQAARKAEHEGETDVMAEGYAMDYALSLYISGSITMLKYAAQGIKLPPV